MVVIKSKFTYIKSRMYRKPTLNFEPLFYRVTVIKQ